MITYTAGVIQEIDNGPNYWKYLRVGKFRDDGSTREQVGEYRRNYNKLYQSFHHFRVNDDDYALYSPHYTATRILKLPSCADIGGEEPHKWGFCPVEYYVPTYIDRETRNPDGRVTRRRIHEPTPDDLQPDHQIRRWINRNTGEPNSSEQFSYAVTPVVTYPFGFVAGCLWGDENSWKVQHLDLSEAAQGILKREERFGYSPLPKGMSLKEAVGLADYQPDNSEDWGHTISIIIEQKFDLRTGARVTDLD